MNGVRTRPDIMSRKGIVSTSSIQASMTGIKILNSGGNIADSAIGTSAVLAVTQNNLCGLGGDGFALLRKNNKVISINSSGKSSRNIDADIYEKRGLKSIPYHGSLAAITVPGLVGLWIELEKHASFEIRDLLADAIKISREGFPVTHNYAKSIEATLKRTGDKNFIETFSNNGMPPMQGDIFYQEDLANIFQNLSDEGLESFYRGDLADKMVGAFKSSEIVIDSQDLRDHHAIVGRPISSDYEDRTVYELPPNSQGAAVNFNLNALKYMEDERITREEKLIKSQLISNKFRRQYIGDPDRMPLPQNFLDESFFSKIKEEDLNGKSASGKDGDTTYFAIATENGDSISMIQSNYTGFGSACVPTGTGISMQNRGSYFSLDPDHHNFLEPSKRTFHTLCACMIEREGQFEYALGTMGGDIQPQVHVNKIYEMINLGLSPQESIDLPRMSIPANIYEDPDLLVYENGKTLDFDINKYFKKFHQTNYLNSAHGHCQIIKMGENGTLFGGADPRGDGFAMPL
ncbi:MAG: gamma-glutamyltransferase family protein [Cuniculiplasma sp.]